MIIDMIGLVVVTVFIVFFFIASTILSWEKQTEKYNKRKKK